MIAKPAGHPQFDLRGLLANSLLEWDNMVAAVAIAGGCNLRCPFCHSWRYVTGLDGLPPLDPELLFRLLERQKGWIDGVVFTGGEPTLQPGLGWMLRRAREYGVKTKLHTNGTRPDVVAELLAEKLVDCLSLDYKAPLDKRFFAAAGIKADEALLDRIKTSFRLAAESGVDKEYHTTLAPRYVDLAALEDMGKALEPGGVWYLQQFENRDCLDPQMAHSVRYDKDKLEAFRAAAQKSHGKVVLKEGS